MKPALLRLGAGVIYLAIHLVGSHYVPETYIETNDFKVTQRSKRALCVCFYLTNLLNTALVAIRLCTVGQPFRVRKYNHLKNIGD